MPIAESKLDVARKMAESHVLVDSAVAEVYLLEEEDERADTPIKLLEVVEGIIERGIEPVYFRPDEARGVPYASIIIELSPREWQMHKRRPISVRGQELTVGSRLAAQ